VGPSQQERRLLQSVYGQPAEVEPRVPQPAFRLRVPHLEAVLRPSAGREKKSTWSPRSNAHSGTARAFDEVQDGAAVLTENALGGGRVQ